MNVDTSAILALSPAEKLELVELLWDNLGKTPQEVPLPAWVVQEGLRRRNELRSDPSIGRSHEETWEEIHAYRQYVREKIEEGLADAAADRLLSTDEVRKHLGL